MSTVGYYGDDFTGSVDVLLQYRRAGLAGVLVTSAEALADTDAPVVGIAGVSRSLPTETLESEVLPAFAALDATKPRLLQYKVCSTADSSPRIGSIGRVIELARARYGERPIVAAFAQPDFGRYTAFGHHFAREGDTVYRLDRQPTMRAHPVTPSTESDLRVHVGTQTALPVGGIDWTDYADPDLVRLAVASNGDAAVLVADALTDAHLDVLADALLADTTHGPARFLVGSGGISAALARRLVGDDALPPLEQRADAARGPVLVLNGSVSARTAEQIDRSGWDVSDAFDAGAPATAAGAIAAGRSIVVTSASGVRSVGPDEVAERLVAAGLAVLEATPPARLLLCGGDTSGAVLRRLGYRRLSILAQPWGNVALLRATGDGVPPIELALKGGQMGTPDLFERILEGTISPTDEGQR